MKLIFDEEMQGFVCPQETDAVQGYNKGQKQSYYCAINVSIIIDDIDSFIQITDHSAELSGFVTVPGLGTNLTIVKGELNLFDIGAKNKTHCYAYYTLCLKNIYGALSLADKFKEYHCKRGIYQSAIEYLTRYPVHFGFIDAYVSADGPFGIFSDKTPNYTRTLIGGENIVAVDWIGASKMGINPMISEYMQRAVRRFGKPRIQLKGDIKEELYSPWENVPVQLSWSVNSVLDNHYRIGNIFYSAFSNMDETAFPRKDDFWLMKLARFLNKPLRDLFFKQGNEAERLKLMKHFYTAGPFDEPEV